MPYAETDKADTQMSFYAATKKATEAMAHSYAHLYDLPVTMFRFFTVYGPWGRPDMALFKFVKAMLNGDSIDVFPPPQGGVFTELDLAIENIGASEIVVPEGWDDLPADAVVRPRTEFTSDKGEAQLKAVHGVATLDGFGQFSRAMLAAAGGLVGRPPLHRRG